MRLRDAGAAGYGEPQGFCQDVHDSPEKSGLPARSAQPQRPPQRVAIATKASASFFIVASARALAAAIGSPSAMGSRTSK